MMVWPASREVSAYLRAFGTPHITELTAISLRGEQPSTRVLLPSDSLPYWP